MEDNDYFNNYYIISYFSFHFIYSLGMQGSVFPGKDGWLFFLSDLVFLPQHQVNLLGTCLSKRQLSKQNLPRTPVPLPASIQEN